MNAIQKQLRRDIETKIGFKILSSTDTKILISMLEEQEINGLGFNTLRRFWGLLPQTKPTQNTLNKLSSFLGYSSFTDYLKEKNKYKNWHDDVKFQRIKYNEDLSKPDLEFIYLLCINQNTISYFITLFENALQNKKWNFIQSLFDSPHLPLFGYDKTDEIQNNLKIAVLISLTMKSISLLSFKSLIQKLVKIKGYKEHIVYMHVDLLDMNNRYGITIDLIEKQDLNFKEQVFIKLLKGQTYYLTHGTTYAIKIDETELLKLPETLLGRYFGFQILHASLTLDADGEHLNWELFSTYLAKLTDIRNYLHEFLPHLILAKRFKKLDFLIDNYYEDVLDIVHVHNYLDVFLYNLIDVMVSFKSNDNKRAKIVFKNLDVDKIVPGSYCDYYLIFYNITGYHLSIHLKEKEKFKKDYLAMQKRSGFKLFDEKYLLNFFI